MQFHPITDPIICSPTKGGKGACEDNGRLLFSGEHTLSCRRLGIDRAYVEPNEPQMIDVTFVKSNHIWAGCFLGKWLISFREPPLGYTINGPARAPVWALTLLLAAHPAEVHRKMKWRKVRRCGRRDLIRLGILSGGSCRILCTKVNQQWLNTESPAATEVARLAADSAAALRYMVQVGFELWATRRPAMICCYTLRSFKMHWNRTGAPGGN